MHSNGGFSGRDLAERLSQLKPNLKIVLSSGYSPEVLQHRGGLLPGMKFLAKPYEPDSLARVVRELLDEKGASSVDPP